MNGERVRRVAATGVALLVVAGVIGWIATAMHGIGGSASSSSGVSAAASPVGGFREGAAGAPDQPSFVPGASGGGSGAFDATGANGDLAGPKIVKVASVQVQVRKGTFPDRFQQAIAVAAANDGFVETSDTIVGRFRSGTVTIRVPADRFEAALAQLKGLGTVRAAKVSGQDVTSRFVDLEAQLRNWRAQEVVLLRLMGRSTTIADSIKVQQQLQNVQGNIEELEGQIRLLDDQTAMSSITVSMNEAGPFVAPVKTQPLAQAWHDALDGFVAVIAAVVVGLGYLIPLGLVVLVGWLGWRGVRRVQRRRTTVAAQA